jgi:Mrp family chromosome partitioning ATPase
MNLVRREIEADDWQSPRPVEQTPRLEVLAHACGLPRGEGGRPRLIEFVSARSGEGTSTVALQFARSLNRLAGPPVLLVDATPHDEDGGMPTLIEVLDLGLPIERAVASLGDGLGVAKLGSLADRGGRARHVGHRDVWAAVRARFAAAVIDAPALERSHDAIALAEQVDAVIVVVEAERTRAPVVEHLVDVLRRAEAPVIGTVLNKRRYRIPRFLYSRL